MGVKHDEGYYISQSIVQLSTNLSSVNSMFSPNMLTVLASLYQHLDEGLTGRDIERILGGPNGSAVKIAQRLAGRGKGRSTNLGLCTFESEEGMGNFKVLRFTTAGLRWYEENVLGPFLAD